MQPRVAVLRTDGTNCDVETYFAFTLAGGECHYVHVNELKSRKKLLRDYQIMVIPGGFSYGDDIMSGKVLAVELLAYLREQLEEFLTAGKPILGICNGFQVLVRTGVLPTREVGRVTAALMVNDSARFECRWVNLKVEESPCIFTRGLAGKILQFQAAHGEGKFFASETVMAAIEANRQAVLRYADACGNPTMDYPANPNGSLNAIAGICDTSGLVLGLMPHPERYVKLCQHPNWRRQRKEGVADGLAIFINAVAYVRES